MDDMEVQKGVVSLWEGIRAQGVKAREGIVTVLPPTPEARWALLTPYIGKPLKEIPKEIVLLFSLGEAGSAGKPGMAVPKKSGFASLVRALPAEERMVTLSSEEEVFI